MSMSCTFVLSILLALGGVSGTPGSCKEEPVLVIGAGLSGLAAARDLQDRGCLVEVFEARDRLGGRSYSTTDPPGSPFDFEHDLGGQYQHGSKRANSISWLAQQFGIGSTLSGGDSAYIGEEDKVVWIRGRNGSKYRPAAVNKGFRMFDEWWRQCTKFLRKRVGKRELRDINLKYVSEYVFESVLGPLTQDEQALLDFHVTINFDEDWGVNHALFPLVGIDENDGFYFRPIRGEDKVLPGGMTQIMNILADGDPSSSPEPGALEINLEHVVTKVEHGESGCTITYYDASANGSRQMKTASGSSCLVTIPLAVLAGTGDQTGDIEFVPELSASKQVAIRTRGIGHQNFALAKFDYPFWRDVDPEKTVWLFVDSRGDMCDRDLGEEFEFFGEWLDMSAFKGDVDHYYLQSFVTSDKYWIEGLSDQNLQRMFVKSLERYYGTGKVPKPTGFKFTRWTSDPFARSSYSGLWVRSTDQEWFDLARPESASLYFAGEHTNYDGRYQTLDGAYNTGTREAERIAARPWNEEVVSQASEWMNPFAFSTGWETTEDDNDGRRNLMNNKSNGRRNNRGTKIPQDPNLYKVDRATRLQLNNIT